MPERSPFRSLADVLRPGRSLMLPGAYDALSAMLVEESGFAAVYIGSYGTAASGHGLPDAGALTLDELARHARAVAGAVSVPVIADAEGGFFDAANIWRTVRAFEEAGVCAVHIEDHAGGKHTDLPQTLIPLDAMLGRLKAAMDARANPDFAIIARTDAIWALGDEAEALARIRAFAEIGVEYVFPTGATPAVLRRFREAVPVRYVVVNMPEVRDPAEWDGAADIVIDYGYCLRAASKAISRALALMRGGRSADETDPLLEAQEAFEQRFGYDRFSERARKYAG